MPRPPALACRKHCQYQLRIKAYALMDFSKGRSQDEQDRMGQGVVDWLAHGTIVAKTNLEKTRGPVLF